MKTLTVHFHEPSPTNWMSRQIAKHDDPGRFCHASLEIDNLRYEAHCDGGVRFRVIDLNDHTIRHDIPLEEGEYELVRRFCQLEAGSGYDICGVGRFKLGILKADPEKWFCSELVLAALQAADLYAGLAPHMYSPNALFMLLTQNQTL